MRRSSEVRGERRGVCCARLHGATRNQGVDYLLLPIFEHLAYGALICFFGIHLFGVRECVRWKFCWDTYVWTLFLTVENTL